MIKNNRLVLMVLALFIFGSCAKQGGSESTETTVAESQAPKDELDAKVDEIFSKMTVEDKAGQMTQVNLNVVLYPRYGTGYQNNDGVISPALLDTAIVRYKVGFFIKCN